EDTDPAVNTSLGVATASDACDGTPTVDYADAITGGACPQEYVITRTWTAEDADGNTATCIQIITVDDSTPPTALCQDITVFLDANGMATFDAADVDNGST